MLGEWRSLFLSHFQNLLNLCLTSLYLQNVVQISRIVCIMWITIQGRHNGRILEPRGEFPMLYVMNETLNTTTLLKIYLSRGQSRYLANCRTFSLLDCYVSAAVSYNSVCWGFIIFAFNFMNCKLDLPHLLQDGKQRPVTARLGNALHQPRCSIFRWP